MTAPTGILLVLTDCADRDQDDAFNSWYGDLHIPDVLATGLILEARRFVRVTPGQPAGPKYLALYQTATEDPHEALRALGRKWVPGWQAQGRMLQALVIDLATTYRPLSDLSTMPGSGDLVLMMAEGRNGVAENELENWCRLDHLPEARGRTIFDAVSLHRNTTPRRGAGELLTLYDTTDPIEGLRTLVDDLLPTRITPSDRIPPLGVRRTAAFRRIF